MIEGDWWRTAIAFWGAALSTILAVLKWREASPIIYLEPLPRTENGFAAIVVRNPYRKPLQIVGIRIVKPASVGVSVTPLSPDDLRGAIKQAWKEEEGIFNCYIAPNSDIRLQIIFATDHALPDKGWAVICLRWHRHDYMPRLPKIIFVTKERMKQLYHSS